MDKDLASAIMLERCSCYDRALDAAKKVLARGVSDSTDSSGENSNNAFLARKIIKNLGEEFLKQRFMDKAMECYQVLIDHDPAFNDCPESDESETFTALGPNSVEIKTVVSQDVFELLKTIEENECSKASNEEDLLREAVYLLILKYASHPEVRGKLFNKLEKVIRKDQ